MKLYEVTLKYFVEADSKAESVMTARNVASAAEPDHTDVEELGDIEEPEPLDRADAQEGSEA